jgi:hypothetical protein
LWDAATKKPIGLAMTHPTDVGVVAFSPDGQVALTVSSGLLQPWEASTALPLGPPLPWDMGAGRLVAFGPDGQSIRVAHNVGYRLFPLKPAVLGDARRVVLSAQVLTGLELDSGGAVSVLDAATWNDRRRQLEELGGSILP